MTTPARRTSDHSCHHNISHILLHGDISLACVVLGMMMIAWSAIGLMIVPRDMYQFALDFFIVAPLFWAFNGAAIGAGFIYVACRGFPAGFTLALGIYGTVIYTWIAVARPVASITSGVTLNLAVIFLSCLLIHRSGARR